jgi:hypothetical protein
MNKTPLVAFLVALCVSGPAGSLEPFPVLAEFDGVALRWVAAAAPEFERLGADPALYKVRVVAFTKTVAVGLKAPTPDLTPTQRSRIRGSPGRIPDFYVEFDKSTGRVIAAGLER